MAIENELEEERMNKLNQLEQIEKLEQAVAKLAGIELKHSSRNETVKRRRDFEFWVLRHS